jgi:tetratricopeptide (TPR) repeat protein
MPDRPAGDKLKQREIRVFVSSTFRDFIAERDELAKRVFPALRKICAVRHVVFTDVDLRWGVTTEQAADGQVLPICLREIDKCRPYFIGLLGERYGWVPDSIPDGLMAEQAWLAEHLDRSVTELEIIHGVLANPAMAGRTCFYFRDPAYVDTVPVNKHDDFVSKDQASADKQADLKNRIRASSLPLAEDYPDPQAVADMILKFLTDAIDTEFPRGSEPDPLDREALDHEIFARSRQGVYIGRQEYFDRLDAHVAGTDQPLVILGESGAGKSALVANWVARYRQARPDDFVLTHFIGGTPDSTDWTRMLRRIMGEFKRRFNIQPDIPDKPEELCAAFANWLSMAAARGRVILILDALNQLEDKDQAPDLVWLPSVIPANIRLIVSTLPSRPLDDLVKRGWPTMEVNLLAPDERKQLICDYLGQYAHELSPDRVDRIASVAQSANPLYLRAMLEELRIIGVHEQLDRQIDSYLEADDVASLYELILECYEGDYERENPGLVREAMRLIWAARRGLSEPELLAMLGTGGESLPRAHWSPLFIAADHSLINRSGQLTFAHDYLRQAVKHKYLPTPQEQHAAHLRIADYFEARALDSRQIDELPWQLAEAESWQRLYSLLAQLPFFRDAWNVNQFEVKTYWAKVEQESDLRMLDAYREFLATPERFRMADVGRVARLLGDTGHPRESECLEEVLSKHLRGTGDVMNLQVCLGNRALILADRGDLDAALALYREQERICRELGIVDGLQRTLGNQALILADRGDLDGAMRLHKEQERICRELGNKNSLQVSLGNQGLILADRGDLDGGMALHKEKERICRELGNSDGLQNALGNQAVILADRGDLDGAMALHKEKERICRESGNAAGLQNALGNQALILADRGDLDSAMTLHKEKERICRELEDVNGLQAALGNRGLILMTRDDLDGAMALFKKGERICRELGDKNSLQASLSNQALILHARGELDGAVELLKEAERMCRELGYVAGLKACLVNHAVILKTRGDLDGAMALFKEGERICRELGDKNSLQVCLGSQAMILNALGDLDGALALFQQHERICRELENGDSLQSSLCNQAMILYARGHLDGAMVLWKEQERICRAMGHVDGLQRSLGNQALVLQQRGNLDGAKALFVEVERICRELEDARSLAIALANHSLILAFSAGHSQEALAKVEEARRLASDHGYTSLLGRIKEIHDLVRSEL